MVFHNDKRGERDVTCSMHSSNRGTLLDQDTVEKGEPMIDRKQAEEKTSTLSVEDVKEISKFWREYAYKKFLTCGLPIPNEENERMTMFEIFFIGWNKGLIHCGDKEFQVILKEAREHVIKIINEQQD